MKRALVLLALFGIAGPAAAQQSLFYMAKMYSVCGDAPDQVLSDAHSFGTVIVDGDEVVLTSDPNPENPIVIPGFTVPKWKCGNDPDQCNSRNTSIMNRSRFVGMTSAPVVTDDFVFLGTGDQWTADFTLDLKLELKETTGEILKGRGRLQMEVPNWQSHGRCRSIGRIRIGPDRFDD